MADDTTMKFKADISQLKAAMQQASRAIKVANSDFKAATAGMDNWSKSADGLSLKLNHLNTVLKNQKKQLSLAKQELEKTKAVYGENAAETERAKIKYNNFLAAVRKTESQLTHYEKELDDVEKGLKDTGDAAEQSGKDAKKGADGFTIMKGALASLVASGIRAAINGLRDLSHEAMQAYREFDEGYDNIIKATGATGKAADELESSYKKVTKSVVGDFNTLGSALGEVNTRFGFTGSELEKATVQFQKFSTLTGVDATEAVRLVSRAMGDAGIDASEYGSLLDQLAVAAQASGISVDTLTESITKYGAPMRALGFDTKESIALFSQWEKAGVNTQIAFSGMRKAISNWGKANKDPREEFKKTLKDIKNTPTLAKATTKAIEVFGAKAGPDLADAIKEGRFSYEDFLKVLDGSGDAVNKTYKQTQNGFDKVKLTIQGVRTEMGDFVSNVFAKYEPQISSFIKNTASKAKEFLSWFLANSKTIINVISAIGGALATVFVVNKIATFANSIKTLITTFTGLKAAALGAAVAEEGVTAATLNATAATTALKVATMALPWIAVGAAILAVTGGLIKYSESAKKAAMAEYQLTETQKKTIDAANKSYSEYKEFNKTRQESVDGSVAEFDYLTKLKNEYNTLIGTNGKVKKGYEDRASFILGELASALGVERSEIEKNIGANGKLSDSIDKVIQKKKAEAVLSASESAYTTAIQKREEALQKYQKSLTVLDSAEKKYNDTRSKAEAVTTRYNELLKSNSDAAERYLRANQGIIQANDTAKASYDKAAKGVNAAEKAYIGYNQTISNYEGLSAAVLSGDVTKINNALVNLQKNFISAKDGTKKTLEQQLKDYQSNYKAILNAVKSGMPGVTQEQVSQAKKMVNKAKKELDGFKNKAASLGKKAGTSFAKGVSSTSGKAGKAGKSIAGAADKGAKTNKAKSAGENLGSSFAKGVSSKKGAAKTAGTQLGSNANKGVKSYNDNANTSGVNFAQGFINGIGSLFQAAFTKAFGLGQKAHQGLKKGQKEGSPSKLTYQSGVYFVQGYINGISAMQKSLVGTVQNLVGSAIAELAKMTNFNFAAAGQSASDVFSNKLSKQIDYIVAKIQYQNEAKIKDFDNTIKTLESNQKKKEDLQSKIDRTNKRIKTLEKKNKLSNSEKKELKNLKSRLAAYKKSLKKYNQDYKKLIATQEKYKDAYQTASQQMLSEFQTAINDYQQKAQALIDDTINGITDKYNQRYDELISKQDNLIDKLKSAGSLFEISGAGVITVNDIKEQTKAITDYTNKLKSIKEKVSSELFDEITTFDMTEGSAFLDQLLAMSESDLDAYNKAYSEKIEAAQKYSKEIYKSDFDTVASDYKNELNHAFDGITDQLKELGNQAMKGFVDGLTKNTDYLDSNVKLFVKSMVDTFKKQLQIASPSKVMFSIGEYTGEGFDDGLLSIIKKVQKTASMIANSVSMPLDSTNFNYAAVKSAVGSGSVSNNNIVNNYNLVQNNTSPKSLSALETYQARRRQIAMLKVATI